MTNTNELMNSLTTILENNGFQIEPLRSYNSLYFSKDGKYYKQEVEGYSYPQSFGYLLELTVVNKHNNAEQNTSVNIEIVECEHSSGRVKTKERVNINMSEKQINNRIKKIMDLYETL